MQSHFGSRNSWIALGAFFCAAGIPLVVFCLVVNGGGDDCVGGPWLGESALFTGPNSCKKRRRKSFFVKKKKKTDHLKRNRNHRNLTKRAMFNVD